MTLDWSDLNLNGMPALLRALQELDKRETALRSQQSLLMYQINPEDVGARLAAIEKLMDDLIIRIEDLEDVIGAGVAPMSQPHEQREVIEDLGHGWRLERQPTNTPAGTAGVLADTWIVGDWVQQFATAADAR